MSATFARCWYEPCGPTFGLVCVSPRRFPRSLAGVDRLVSALDALLLACSEEDAALAAGGEIWLEEVVG